VRDQLFEVYCEPIFRVTDAATNEVLVPWQPLAAPALGPYALNFHERTTGLGPLLLSNVCPPSSISIDPDEVARQILPATLRPSLTGLAETFREISFLPTSKLVLSKREVPGITLESASAPTETRTDTIALTLVFALPNGPGSLKQVMVGDARRIDLSQSAAELLVRDGKLELHLADVAVPPGQSVDVLVLLAGANTPQRILTITAEKGELRPEWHR
jgi:hypothetical protein